MFLVVDVAYILNRKVDLGAKHGYSITRVGATFRFCFSTWVRKFCVRSNLMFLVTVCCDSVSRYWFYFFF